MTDQTAEILTPTEAAEDDGWDAWRPVVGFEDLYEVSNLGCVRRVGKAARNGNGRGGGARIGRIKKLQLTEFGYLQVVLWSDGKAYGKLVHCLVAEAFTRPRPDNCEVNHKDGNKQNNRYDNLEWLTRSDNMFHAYRTGLKASPIPLGEKHHSAVLSDEQVSEIRRTFKRGLGPTLARRFGVNTSTIYRVSQGMMRKSVAP